MPVQLIHAELTEQVIAAYYEVYNKLGYGFLEKVYENAMVVALRKRGFEVQQQWPISVEFEGTLVGEYIADLFVDKILIVEIKAAKAIDDSHKAQLLNYLKATEVKLGLLFNFGPEPGFTRKAMTR